MTNAEIILKNSIFLMEEGVLKGTDEIITVSDEKGERNVQKPEPIHTFQAWRKLGYSVKKGEHAIARFPIWKFEPDKKKKDQEDGDEDRTGKCFMKVAFFFTADQVEKMDRAK